MNLIKVNQDLIKLSQGEHPLEEVVKMAGFSETPEEEKPYIVEGRFCSQCENELEVREDEDWDEDGFNIFHYLYCPECRVRL